MTERFSPLRGIRVVDLTKVFAGPLSTQYLGELGADIIKVEPVHGDDSRQWPPFKDGESSVYMSMNKNKRSISIDLKTEAGQKAVHKLVAEADVFVESFRTGVTQRLNIDYETLKAIKPDIIYASVSGYGRTGPMAKSPGYDLMVQAFSGVMDQTGERGGGPARAAFAPMDQGTGLHVALGILAALRERDLSGKGQWLQASLFETALSFQSYTAQMYWADGTMPVRNGTAHDSVTPYQAFKASDGYVMIGAGNEKLWKSTCAALELDDIVDDPRYATNSERIQRFDELVSIVNERVATFTVEECVNRLTEAGVPTSPINTIKQALEHPQAEAIGLISEFDHPISGKTPTVSMPLVFEGYGRKPRSAPPLLGQHSREILKEAGFDEAEIEALVNDGVVKSASS